MARKTHQPHLSTLKDARAVRTRQVLRTALLELLEKKPLELITIRDICKAAHIGYVTFYRHYQSKESLLNDIAVEQVQRLAESSVLIMDTTNTRNACVALCTYINEHRALWSTLCKNGAAKTISDELIRVSTEVAANRAQSCDWLPANIGIAIAVSGTIELIGLWLRQENPLSISQIAEIQDRIIISPIISQSPPLLPSKSN